ncbi:hypothetical protein HY212_01840 [Candidatus Pacearchaeota archaeon]|nr:hypothetical protein [Candidatus Pacearchaeota archaeon]
MNKPKSTLELYIDFLIATQKQYSCLELEKVSPIESMAHDSPNRLLNRLLLEPQQLWLVVQEHINPRTRCE